MPSTRVRLPQRGEQLHQVALSAIEWGVRLMTGTPDIGGRFSEANLRQQLLAVTAPDYMDWYNAQSSRRVINQSTPIMGDVGPGSIRIRTAVLALQYYKDNLMNVPGSANYDRLGMAAYFDSQGVQAAGDRQLAQMYRRLKAETSSQLKPYRMGECHGSPGRVQTGYIPDRIDREHA